MACFNAIIKHCEFIFFFLQYGIQKYDKFLDNQDKKYIQITTALLQLSSDLQVNLSGKIRFSPQLGCTSTYSELIGELAENSGFINIDTIINFLENQH